MLWCFADYVPAIWDREPLAHAPHERFFGLWRADGTPKPAVRHFGRYTGISRRPTRDDAAWADVSRERFYEDPSANLRRMYGRYVREAVAPTP
jgi:hypothetical protein